MGGFYSDPSFCADEEISNIKYHIGQLYKQLARRNMPVRRHKILMRIRDCEAKMVALTLAHR